ncbi:MAG TPA: PLP-dependent aminotransferase family protein [Terriglobales bacterium]|nr:PLP-dependent aminotransferase family protein [Terriglobales bacterium]
MPKEATTLPLPLPQPPPAVPRFRWFYEELRAAILAGRLQPGARLPATRDLAREYALSRGTIVAAFEQLASEGYVEGRTGSGTYVSQVLPEELLQVARVRTQAAARRRRPSLSAYARRLQPVAAPERGPVRAFRASLPALDAFPTGLWAQVAARRLRRLSSRLLAGGDPLGYRPLRQAVAEYLNASRGVKCTWEQVLIVSGVQEALDRSAHLLLNPGDPVWMEEPGYPRAAMVFRAVGARICPTPVNSEGFDLQFGKRRWRQAKLVYVTPAHQFPLGVTMSLRRRLELLEWAREARAVIFEDDYDSEYRYAGRPIPAMQGLDRSGVVVFSGSFSDVLFPALRLGYVVIPPELVEVFAAAESSSTHHPPLLEQAILADFISEGHFARHIRRMRELYAERLAAFLEAAHSRLAGMLEIPPVEAGLQTVGWLKGRLSAEQAAAAAEKHAVDVVPLSRYSLSRRTKGLLLGFAAVDVPELRDGVQRLARALEQAG